MKPFYRGQLVKVHPRQPPGGRWTKTLTTYPPSGPASTAGPDRLVATPAGLGRNVEVYATQLLDDQMP